MKNINNPLYIYCSSFLIGLIVYSFRWSYLFPPIETPLLLFVIFSIIFSAIFGLIFSNIKEFKVGRSISRLKHENLIFIFVFFGFCLEFIHFKGVPLFLLIKNLSVDYQNFGIPTFHVFLITFAHFFLGYSFARYKESHKNYYIFIVAAILINDVFIGSRGMFIFGLLIILFIHIRHIKKLKIKHFFWSVILIIFVGFGFGLMGQYRSARGNEKYVLEIFGANDRFYNANISSAYLWIYVYVASPLANLQKTINDNLETQNDFKSLFIYDMLNEVISKRIEYTADKSSLNYRIAPYLTVGSIYFAPYCRMGWLGMVCIFLFLLVYIVFYRFLLFIFPRFGIVGIATLNALVLLCLFDNMLKTAFSVTLAYPILYDIIQRIKYKINYPIRH